MPTPSEIEEARFFKQLTGGFPQTNQLIKLETFLAEYKLEDRYDTQDVLKVLIECGFFLKSLAACMSIVTTNAAAIAILLTEDLLKKQDDAQLVE